MPGRKLIVVAASVATLMSAAVVAAPLADAKPKVKAPAKVSKARVTAASSTAAAISWTNPKSKNFKATIVRVAPGAKVPGSVTSGSAGGTVSKTKHAVTLRLAPGTVYTVGLFSSDGKKHYSKPVAVRVQTAPAGVTGVQAQATFNSLILRWSYLPSKTTTGVIVRYAKGGSAPASPRAGIAAPTVGKVASVKVAKLQIGSTYAFSLWTRDAAGRISPRAAALFTTPSTTTGGLSGMVTGGKTAKPLGDVNVEAYQYDSQGNDDYVGDANTLANGRYSFPNLSPGRYYLCFYPSGATGGDSAAGYLYSCTSNIQVSAGDPVAASINLEAGAGFSGVVTNSSTHATIENVEVDSRGTDEDSSRYDTTTDEGQYTLTRVPATTTTKVCFYGYADVDDANSFGYQEKCVPVVPVAGKITPLDVELDEGGALDGKLDLNGASEASIYVFDDKGGRVDSSYLEDGDDPTYKTGGLAAGDYTVCVQSNDSDYESQCYNGTADGTPWSGDTDELPDAADVKPVTVVVGETKSGIDFTLQRTP